MVNRPLQLELIAPSASPEETAAIVTALERFMRAAPAAASLGESPEPWLRAAILEGVARDEESDMPNPWINT